MIKILFFIETLSGGGAEKVLQNLVNNMDNEKFDITVQTVWKENTEGLLNKNIRYKYIYPYYSKINNYKYRLSALLKTIYPLHIKDNYDIKTIDTMKEDHCCNNDIEKLFYYFGFDYEKDKDGFYTIDKYEQPNEYVTFEEIGIDENILFEKVKRIKGNATFANSSLKSLKNLESVGGNLMIGSQIEDLGKLKEVGGHFSDYKSKIKTLGCLKNIGGSLYVNCKQIESLGDLETVGESVFLSEAKKINSLGKLRYIGKSLELIDSNVVDLGDLVYVGEDAWFNKTKINDVSKLKFVGEYIYYKNSPLKYSDFSHIKRNHNPLFYLWNKIWYCSQED